ncbi:MAG TPA: 6-bladed beta-propeller [Gemmatimonadaceae bacterium]|nr:6-bladed beta-propeller [Gemmatimonadaceae bacterium]
MPTSKYFARALSVALLCACAAPEKPATPGVHRSTSGDTTIVYTVGDGVWGPLHDAVEVLRVAETSKETTFGQIQMIAPTPDGGLLIHDVKAAEGEAVRQFSPDGKFIRNIGRKGRGPGEYSVGFVAMAVAPNGTIVLREPFTGIKRYRPNGVFINEFASDRRSGSHEFVITSDTTMYLRGSVRTGSSLGVAAMVQYDTAGLDIDSLVAPRWLMNEAPSDFLFGALTPRQSWTIASDGRMVITRSDKLGFLVIDPRTQSTPLVGEVAATPIPISDDERAERERVDKWSEANCGLIENGKVVVEGPKAQPVPKIKPLMKAVDVDNNGRVWLWKRTPSVQIPSHTVRACDGKSTEGTFTERGRVIAAFQLDGTYLGEVRFPDKAGRIVFVGDFAWATVANDEGVQQLIKFRLH